jgi:hypothetical protein
MVGNWEIKVFRQVHWRPFKPWVAIATLTYKKRVYLCNAEGNAEAEARTAIEKAIQRALQ